MSSFRTLCLGVVALMAVGTAQGHGADTNPFFQPSTLPFQTEPFDRIKDSDFPPAFAEAMKQQLVEIKAIANNAAPPTFDNTIVAMEKSGRMLDRVSNVFFTLTGANTDAALEKIEAAVSPKLAAHQDAIYLDPKLFARVEAIYNKRMSLRLDPESLQLLEIYHQSFLRAGGRRPHPNPSC